MVVEEGQQDNVKKILDELSATGLDLEMEVCFCSSCSNSATIFELSTDVSLNEKTVLLPFSLLIEPKNYVAGTMTKKSVHFTATTPVLLQNSTK